MQIDMHYYGTYAIARAAGFTPEDADTIAYSAAFVDDATAENSQEHASKALMYAIATAHHPIQTAEFTIWQKMRKIFGLQPSMAHSHRIIWVPFHFLPGNQGETLQERLITIKNSLIAQQMFNNHIDYGKTKSFRLHLLGIAAHVYLDTFSHYGFSGICSPWNEVKQPSIKLYCGERMKQYCEEKKIAFAAKYMREIRSAFGEFGSVGLGHAGVANLTDLPYLRWSFDYERNNGTNRHSERDNQTNTLEGCQWLYAFLHRAASQWHGFTAISTDFSSITPQLKDILAVEGTLAERIVYWQNAITSNVLFQASPDDARTYNPQDWLSEKDNFHINAHTGNCYAFYQAAAYHRWYVLKDLLPAHNIILT